MQRWTLAGLRTCAQAIQIKHTHVHGHTHKHTHTQIHFHTHTHTHMHTQVHFHARICTCTHRETLTHTHTYTGEWLCWPCYTHEQQLRNSGLLQSEVRPPRWEMASRGLTHTDLQVRVRAPACGVCWCVSSGCPGACAGSPLVVV